MSATVIITGAGGMIGRAAAALLRAAGYDVIALDRAVADVADCGAMLAQARPAEAVVHLAFPTRAAYRRAAPAEARRDVAAGVGNVVRLAAASGARHIVLASSGKVYGLPQALPILEGHPRRPSTFLGQLKLLQESMLEEAIGQENAFAAPPGVTALRLFNVYGLGQREDFVVAHLVRSLRDDALLPLGELDHARDYLHLDDACQALMAVLNSPPEPGVFRAVNAGSGLATSVRELLALLTHITGRTPRLVSDPDRLRPDEAAVECADCARLRRLGWSPEVSLEAGLTGLWQALGR